MPAIRITIEAAGQEPVSLALSPGVYTFGRSPECNVLISDNTVARIHAKAIVGDNDSILLEDLGSTNGTFLEGKRVTAPVLVMPAQTVQMGTAVIRFYSGSLESDEPTIAEDKDILPSITRYELRQEIARGGMGAVFAATQSGIRRNVAVKLMLNDADRTGRQRFVGEARITGQLEHPNIVPVHEVRLDDQGRPFYSMKLVQGLSLKSVLSGIRENDGTIVARYPLSALITIFQKICDAVAFAHSRGVIHRDLKPENIMVGKYGEVLVMDWGLAKVIKPNKAPRPESSSTSAANTDADRPDLTSAGAVMGTPAYMSPEQARGEIDWLDERSDVFSLGSILYHILTLEVPFKAGTVGELLHKVATADCIPSAEILRHIESRLPHWRVSGWDSWPLSQICLVAMRRDPERRYPSVAALQADLALFQNGFSPTILSGGSVTRLVLSIRRNLMFFAGLATGVIGAAVCFIYLLPITSAQSPDSAFLDVFVSMIIGCPVLLATYALVEWAFVRRLRLHCMADAARRRAQELAQNNRPAEAVSETILAQELSNAETRMKVIIRLCGTLALFGSIRLVHYNALVIASAAISYIVLSVTVIQWATGRSFIQLWEVLEKPNSWRAWLVIIIWFVALLMLLGILHRIISDAKGD